MTLIFAARVPAPRITKGRFITAASTQSGRSAGRPGGVTPPSSMPVIRRVSSGSAKETLRAPIFLRTVLFTSSRVVASRTQATNFSSPVFDFTRMAFAESSIAWP